MLLFLKSLITVSGTYRDKLLEGGCNSSVIDGLPAQFRELDTRLIDQQTFMDERGVITQERVEKLNALYDLLSPISSIAHIIYDDNEAQLAKYAMPRPQSSTNSTDDLIVS